MAKVHGLSPLERFLRLFTDVRPGEGSTALLMFANVFLVLCAYYFVKPLREGWISVSSIEGLSRMEVKAYSSFLQAMLLIPVVIVFGRLSERWTRGALITRATLFCMSNIVLFWFLQPGFFVENLPYTGIVFYLWVGMFGVFVVAQFWAFAADVYSDGVGRRILPLIAIGATAGGAFGSSIARWLVDSGLVDTNMLLVAALFPLGVSIVLTRVVDASLGRATPGQPSADVGPAEEAAEPESAEPGKSGFSLVFSSGFLIAVAVITLMTNWVNTNGENALFEVFNGVVTDEAVSLGVTGAAELRDFRKEENTVFYAGFYGMVNWLALFLQGFVASRVLKYGGFGVLLLLLPVVALASYTAMAIVGTLFVVRTMKIAENATDYSINNTARNVLWLPIDASIVYKAKPTIDTVCARVGDGLAAFTVLVFVNLLDLPVTSFFALNISLAAIWLGLSFVVIRGHRALTRESEGRVAA